MLLRQSHPLLPNVLRSLRIQLYCVFNEMPKSPAPKLPPTTASYQLSDSLRGMRSKGHFLSEALTSLPLRILRITSPSSFQATRRKHAPRLSRYAHLFLTPPLLSSSSHNTTTSPRFRPGLSGRVPLFVSCLVPAPSPPHRPNLRHISPTTTSAEESTPTNVLRLLVILLRASIGLFGKLLVCCGTTTSLSSPSLH